MSNAIPEAMRLAKATEAFINAMDAPLDDGNEWGQRFEAAESNLRAALKAWKRKVKINA